jgi:hypothetical protein
MPTRRVVILQRLLPPVGGYVDPEPRQAFMQPYTTDTQDVRSLFVAQTELLCFGLEVWL